MDDQQRARASLAAHITDLRDAAAMLRTEHPRLSGLADEFDLAADELNLVAAALRAAPEAVALRTAMTTLEQIASAADDQGAKFNAMGALRFLQTQPVELSAAPEGFVLVPEIATEEMLFAAYPRNERIDDSFDRHGAWADCIAARPQGVK